MTKQPRSFAFLPLICLIALSLLFLFNGADAFAAMPIGNVNIFTQTQSILQKIAEGLMDVAKWVALVVLLADLIHSTVTKKPLIMGARPLMILLFIVCAGFGIDMVGGF